VSRPAADPDDPKGLIREGFRIDGIGPAECRSILIDWALSLPVGTDSGAALARLARRHADAPADHPMRRLLAEGVAGIAGAGGAPAGGPGAQGPGTGGRRGGAAGRRAVQR